MKKLILGLALFTAGSAIAQELPQPSPAATVKQTIGLTNVDVNYSRPSAKERAIFGELVPFNEMWRTGANLNTIIEFSTDVNFGGTELKAGKYSLFTIPAKGEWTVVLNSKTDMWGTGNYSKVNDVLRISTKSMTVAHTESFTISMENLTANSGDLTLSWEKTKISVSIKVDVQAKALKNIEGAIADASEEDVWKVYRNAANYHYNNKIDLEKGLEYMKKSLGANDDSWYSYWIQAEIMAELGMKKEAVTSAKKALEKGEAASKKSGTEFKYAKMINSGMDSWKS